ncbi:GGDEF domain-containing protein [Jannaschia seohaensis]|uniref:guanylate cyclase n=1 Tax=Jannaschia seohaensis TaxID=475081 RepID=A0A2Y9AQ82_9RHOB|nr:GGDEF domain-containing protein [Jannaschia seohaensis]PWJ20426.1 diguanylate cyclase (GGDEF)-like protein [Jannaschia seohaensis]SSA44509.1 diguanylate cyclase (GGDEF) domain-containing protein [Jannaschia seohaensis]
MRLSIESDLLDALVPFHLLMDRAGRIANVGRSFERIAPGARGRSLFDVIDLRRPAGIATAADLRAHIGERLDLRLTEERNVPPGRAPTRMRGVVYPVGTEWLLLVPYFGADIAEAVARHGLTARDLAEFDLTVEVLFLLEARRVVLAEHARQDDQLRRARSEAERQAITDKLTGLSNRRALDRRLGELSDPEGPPFGLMHLDLDYFKAINDRLGHAAGDFVLAEVGRILARQVRDGDMVARVGGDEFMILLEGCTDLALMQAIAVRIISELEHPILYQGCECRISGSIGITLSEFYDRLDPDQLIGDLDTALYASKNQGRARYNVARPTAIEPGSAH